MSTNKKQQGSKSVRRQKVRDEQIIRRFLDELSWVLSSYDNLDFRALREVVRKESPSPNQRDLFMEPYVSPNPNIHFLVGVLPRIFNDETLFSTNEDIARFAEDILGVRVSRWAKKSKYEIIGHIVCNVYTLDDRALSKLVRVLSRIVADDTAARSLVKKEKDKNIDWNQVIRELAS